MAGACGKNLNNKNIYVKQQYPTRSHETWSILSHTKK